MQKWLLCSLVILLHVSTVWAQESRPNRVLSLDGDGDYVEMADSDALNDIGSQVTMEAWIKATAFSDQWIPIIHKADRYTPNYGNRSYALSLNSSGFIELASAPVEQGQLTLNSPGGPIALNTWYHVAGVVDAESGAMRIFINGAEASRGDFGKDIHISKLPLRIGWWRQETRRPFAGEIDEIRIWNIARTQEEIQATMFTKLSGKEPGLVGYWRFDDVQDTVTDLSPNGISGRLIGDAHFVEARIPSPDEFTILSGVVTDESGQSLTGAFVRLEQDGEEIAQAQSGDSGSYNIVVHDLARGLYDLSAMSSDLGHWQLGVRLDAGERRTLNLTLKEAISISGRVLALDDGAPQGSTLVQAVALHRDDPSPRPKLIFATLSDQEGKYRFINLRPGPYQLWYQIPGGDVYYAGKKDAAPILQIESGKALKNNDFRFAPLKKEERKADKSATAHAPSATMPPLRPLVESKTYTARGGADSMRSAVADAQGYTWFTATAWGMPLFYHFDGKRFTSIDKTVGAYIGAYIRGTRDAEGKVWMAGEKGLVQLWNGRVEKRYTLQDGLSASYVSHILADKDEGVWVSTSGGIGYAHKGNRDYRILPAVGLGKSDLFNIDSEGGIWWWRQSRGLGMTTVHRLVKTAQGISEALEIRLPFSASGVMNYGKSDAAEGFLLKAENGPFIHFHNDGTGYSLDGRLSRYLGEGTKGSLHFGVEAGDELMQIVRDQPDREGNFGYPTSPMRFEFPTKLSTDYELVKVGDEMWTCNLTSDRPVFIIRENKILPGEDMYPSDLMDGNFFMAINDETVWARKWGKREITELHLPEGMEYEVCDLDVNGLTPLQYNRKTRSYYFIYNPNFSRQEGAVSYLVSYQGREWKELLKLEGGWLYTTDIQGNTWIRTLIEGSPHVICITADGGLEQEPVKFEWLSPDDNGGCYFLDSDGTLTYYRERKLTVYQLPDVKGVRNMAAFPDGSVYILTGKALYRWTPEDLRKMTTADGLPAGTPEEIWKSRSRLFFRAAGQIGWIEDGEVSAIDTKRYPQLKDVINARQDEAGRIFFYGYTDETPIREVWTLEEETLTKLPLPGPARRLKFISKDDEVVLITTYDTKIYRYSREQQQFYTLKNVGDLIGYIWDGYIAEGNLIVSGWGKNFLKIDLKKASPTFPTLSFQSIIIDKKTVDMQGSYELDPGSTIETRYIAIEKLSQMNVFYQTRLVGLDDEWSEPTKNESVEFRNLPSGNYRLAVRARGESELWGTPIGFDMEIRILPTPFYTRTGFIIGTILVAFLIPASAFATVLIRQRRQTFEPIQNPYIVGNPIRASDMFFGRQADFEFVRAKLATGQSGLVIVFAGERRSGKTSILFQILGGALGEQFVPALMDMQAMTVDSEAELLEKMASGIDEALVAAGYSPYSTSIDFHAGNSTRTFERFMAQIMETLGDKSLLLLLDEYELIELKIEDGIIRSDLITFFASLLEAHPRLSFIFTGSRHLQRRNTEYWNILIGKSLYRRISFLSVEDAVRLITEPVQDLVIYPRGIPERIIRLTAGQPFYTQVVCQNMMDRLNAAERSRVRQEDVDAVAEELSDNPLPQMIYFWDGLEQEQQGALSLLCEVLEDPNLYASAQMLLDFVQEQNLDMEFELSDMERVLDDLFVSEVLERERSGGGQYEYRFRVDLFRLWARQAHSVWQQAT